MFTPQEVSEKVFPKASFGGYNMVSVDEFLDSLTEDYTALYKENATLKAKLKVLAEKVEEYRATEDAMRSTLLTAQKMASKLVQEAQVEKEQILSAAREEAAQQVTLLDTQTQQAQQKLALAQQKLAEFISRSQELCANQAAFLKTLPETDLTDPQAQQDVMTEDTVRIIENDILKEFVPQAVEEAAAPVEEEAPTQEAAEEEPAAEEAAEPVIEATPQPAAEVPFTADFNLDDLKFGRNYSSDT